MTFVKNMFKYVIFACLPLAVLSDKYAEGSNVIHLNWINFDKLVLQSDHFWLIKCHETVNSVQQEFVNEFEKVAIVLKGLIKVGELHVDSNKEIIKRFGILPLKRDNPMFLIFGVDKSKHEKYYGTRSPRHLVNFVFATVRRRADLVIFDEEPKPRSLDMTGEIYYDILLSPEPWVLAFLLPHDNKSTALYDWWDELATSLHGKAKVGHYDLMIDKEEDSFIHRIHAINEHFQITCFPKGSKTEQNLQTFHGNLTFDNLLEWALDIVDDPIEIAHLTSELMYEDYCQMKMCIIFFLPNLSLCSTLCRHNQLKKLANIAKKYEQYHWSWLWIEGGEQDHLEEILTVQKGNYPTMVAVNSFKHTYAILKGSFFGADIEEFLEGLRKRDTVITPFYKQLPIVPVGKWFPFEHDEL